jgi:hypothetical protein
MDFEAVQRRRNVRQTSYHYVIRAQERSSRSSSSSCIAMCGYSEGACAQFPIQSRYTPTRNQFLLCPMRPHPHDIIPHPHQILVQRHAPIALQPTPRDSRLLRISVDHQLITEQAIPTSRKENRILTPQRACESISTGQLHKRKSISPSNSRKIDKHVPFIDSSMATDFRRFPHPRPSISHINSACISGKKLGAHSKPPCSSRRDDDRSAGWTRICGSGTRGSGS